MWRQRRALTVLLVGVALCACTSPEATRMRSGGSGGDVGNRDRIVEMHAGSEIYYKTPVHGEALGPPTRVARDDNVGRR